MATFFAVCDVNGPISKEIVADDIAGAVAQFEAANTRSWIDDASTDAEDEYDIDGSSMDESEFAAALDEAGCEMVRDLSEHVNGHSMRAYHIAGGWRLWAAK